MLHKTHIGSIVINNYIRKVALSKMQRPKHYEWNGITIKSGNKKLLQKYINKDYKNDIIKNNGNIKPSWVHPDYVIATFLGKYLTHIFMDTQLNPNGFIPKGRLLDKGTVLPTLLLKAEQLKVNKNKTFVHYLVKFEDLQKVIANPTQVGTPRMQIINGQDFYSQTLNPFARNKVIATLKETYYNKFKTIGTTKLLQFQDKINSSYPIYITMEIRDTIKSEFDRTKNGHGRRWDVGNRAYPYLKSFLDFLVEGYIDENENVLLDPLLIDDDRLHLVSGNNSYFTPIEEGETRQLVFHFYKDDRPIWKNILK